MKRFTAILLLMTIMLSLMVTVQAQAEAELAIYARTTGGSLRMRSSKDKSAKVLASYKDDTLVQILENDGTWCYVSTQDGKKGYMMYEYLRLVAAPGHYGWARVGKTSSGFLNIRTQANANSVVAGQCPKDSVLELLGKSGSWYQIRYEHISGFVSANYITFLSNAEVEALSDEERYGKNTYLWDYADEAGEKWGVDTTMTGAVGAYTFSIRYPVSEYEKMNDTLKKWAEDQLALYAPSTDAEGGEPSSLSLQCVTYEADGRYKSVLAHGAYTKGESEKSIAASWTLDTQTGDIYEGGKMFTKSSDALALIKAQYKSAGNSVILAACEKMDDSWLKVCVPTDAGMAVYLNKGDNIAPLFGTQRLVLPYFRLKDTLALTFSEALIGNAQRIIDPTRPIVALSFDDGPSKYTVPIINILDQYGARATFCIVGNRVAEFPKVMEALAASDHEVATHTWAHGDLEKYSEKNTLNTLTRSIEAIEGATGKKVSILRPPYGHITATTKRACKELGLYIVTWSVDSEDWKSKNPTKIYNQIMNNVTSGSVILCHDLYETTMQAMEKVIPALVEKGYQILTISEMYAFREGGVEPGKVYYYLSPDNMDTSKTIVIQ